MMYLKMLMRNLFINNRKTWKTSHFQNRYINVVNNPSLISISLNYMKKTLRQKNINIQDGHVCIYINCPVCANQKINEFNVYINKSTGFFMCKNCESSGAWDILERFIELKNKSESSSVKEINELKALKDSLTTKYNFKDEWKETIKQLKNTSTLSNESFDDLIKNKLNLPKLSKVQLNQLHCYCTEDLSKLYFPLTSFSGQITGYKVLNLHPEVSENTVPTTNATGLIIYKEKKLKNESAVIVCTIEDLLILISEKVTNNIICLPYNFQQIPLQILPIFENYKKLVLWFGSDASGWDSAKHFSKKLEEKRCYFVRPINQQSSPKIAANSGCNLKSIINEAQPICHKSITTFHTLREDILSDLQNIEKVQGVQWSRYPSLNRILKGHRRGEFTILTGSTGCGKTTFMSEYSLDLALQGVNTLWGSFEIKNVRLAKTMLQQLSGVPLEEHLDDFDKYADEFEKLPIYFMTFHGQQTLNVVMEAVEHATYVHDITHVIIDNVQFMMGIAEEPSKHFDRYYRQDVIISAFRSFATKNNCHVTLVIHPRKEKIEDDLTTASIFGGAKATQEADNVLIIQDKRLTNLRGKKFLQVAKNRYSGDLGIMHLDFDKSSLSYREKKKIKTDNTTEESKEIDEYK